ncbi:MAG: HAD-IIIC family phosphatase [Burkholderiaceae bacterium]
MEVLTPHDRPGLQSELMRTLRNRRDEVADAIARAFENAPRWAVAADAHRANRADHVTLNFLAFADYLAESFFRDHATFKHLLVGESVKALYDPTLDDATAGALAVAVLADQRRRLTSLLRPLVSPGAWGLLDAQLADIERVLTAPATKTQRVLLVGDCIFLDIVPFIVGELVESGIRLMPDYVTSKNPVALREELREMSAKRFDLVFFSPFSYEFSPNYAQLSEWRRALSGIGTIRGVVHKAWDDARLTLDLLADLFDCPIHVHNSACVVREENVSKRLVKMKMTARTRALAKHRMNELLAERVHRKCAETFLHVFVLDEDAMVQAAGELEAGAYFYRTELQHPAMFGRMLARKYVDLIYVNTWLMKRKVIVCDLDNTLWDGVIGEGEVQHFHERQISLLALKSKGVVLTINSKNDPANVHWSGGTLSDNDFVCPSISWEPKVQGMKRIQSALNLKIKDYVFVDDREDERELMRMTYPELLCMDATDTATWRRFALWEGMLETNPGMDRTLMYKQREERKAFVREDVASDEERAEMFASLRLNLAITQAAANDLKRVAELINRTNQFNLEGSRTSFGEVKAWHDSPDHVILLGQTTDRFGDMGTTCIAVARCDAGEMHLLPFVLSCRVFGYGIETAMMNRLKSIARERGLSRILGHYVATAQNAPCKSFLADHGFVSETGRWSHTLGTAETADPAWLSVTVD